MDSLSDIQKIRDALQEKGWLSEEELMKVTKIPADELNSLLDEMFSRSEIAMKNGKFLLLEKKEERGIEGKTAKEWFDLGYKEENLEKKIEYYSKCLKLDSKNAVAWNNKGDALSDLERYREAIECFDEGLKIKPKYADMWDNKGIALGELGRYKEAIECFDKALKIDSKHAYAWVNKGNALDALGRYEEAIKCYDKNLEINHREDYTWYFKGITLCKLGRHEEAIECFDKALETDPEYAHAWNNKGIALRHLGRYEEAIRCYDKALEINPNFGEAKNNKKITEEKLREQKATRAPSTIKGKTAEEWYQQGKSHADSGRYEDAAECFDKALEIDPNYEWVWYNKGIALHGLERYEEAITCFDKALELDSQHAAVWYNKGVALDNLEKYEEAIRCYDKALELDPKNGFAWSNKGEALANLGRYEEAIRCYDKALEIDPKDIEAWTNKGEALAHLKRYEEAIRCYERALEINPDFEEAKSNKEIAEEKIREEKIKKVPTMVEELGLTIERAIYDPCKRDFIEGRLPRMKEWINRYDPGAYWFVISLQNNTDKTIEEWDVDLEISSALKIEEAKIEGIEREIPHEAHLKSFKISVPEAYGATIPKGGAQRVYFKLRAEKPKTTYEISGVFKSAISGDVPIRAKEFKYWCDAGMSPEAVKAELEKTFSRKEAARLALSFKTIQELDRMCDREAKTDEYLAKLLVLKNYTEGFSDTFTNQVDEFPRFMKEEQSGYLDDEYKGKVRRFCTNLVDVWISEFLKG